MCIYLHRRALQSIDARQSIHELLSEKKHPTGSRWAHTHDLLSCKANILTLVTMLPFDIHVFLNGILYICLNHILK